LKIRRATERTSCQKHDTEETVEAEDFGVCFAGENAPQAAKVPVDSAEDIKEHNGKTN
jgi:hypothetical protein